MASRLAASILVKLIDQASGPAGKIARALRDVDRAAKMAGKGKFDFKFDRSAAKNVEKMSRSVRDLSKNMRSVGKVDVKIPASSLSTLRTASSHARRLTSELRSAAAAARSIRLNVGGSSGRSPFSAMRRDIQGAIRDMQRLNRLASSSGRGGRFVPGVGGGGGGVGGGGGRRGRGAADGYIAVRAAEAGVRGAGRVARFTGKAGADSMREDARDYLAGLKPEDTERLHKTAVARSSDYRSVDQTTLHEMLRDTAMSMGSVDKSVENSDNLARMAVVMQSMKGPEKAIENVRQFYSALDVLGKNVDPETVKKLSNAYTKATGVEGAEMDMGRLLQVAKQSRAAGAAIDDDFLMYAVPALMQDLGAPQTGTALASGLSQVIGGRATKESIAAQAGFGLRGDNGQMSKSDKSLFLTNPDKYANQVLIPALERGGTFTTGKGKNKKTHTYGKTDINDDAAVTEVLQQLYSNRTVSDIFTKLITQRAQYARKRQQYDAAPGTDAAPELSRRDPYVAGRGVVAQATNVAAEAMRPYMPAFTQAADKLSEALGGLAKNMAENPEGTKVVAPVAAGVIGTVGAWLAGHTLQSLAGNGTGLAANAARLGGQGLIGLATGATTGAVVGGAAAGVAGGALIQESDAMNEGVVTNALMGRDSPTVRLIKEYNKSLDSRSQADFADKVLKSAKMGAFDKNKKMGSIGSALGDTAASYDQSRGSVVQDFLFGRQRGTVTLPGFGFQGKGTATPGGQSSLEPPRRPVMFGGTPGPANTTANLSVPASTEMTEKISAATAEVAKYEQELAKARAQLDGLKSSGEGAFSPEAFGLESKVSEMESAVEKARSKLDELNKLDLSNVDSAVEMTKGKLDALGSTSVTPKVDPSSIANAVSVVDTLLNKLGQVGAAADGAASKAEAAAARVTSAAGKATASLVRSQQTSLTSSPAG